NIFDIISPQDHLVQESGLKAFVLLADFIQEGRWNSTSANTNVLKIFLKRMLESLDTLDEVNGFLSRAQADVKKIALERRLVLEQRYEEIFMQRMHSFKRKVDN